MMTMATLMMMDACMAGSKCKQAAAAAIEALAG